MRAGEGPALPPAAMLRRAAAAAPRRAGHWAGRANSRGLKDLAAGCRLLAVARGCSEAELKAAFRKQALEWHPDRWVSPAQKVKAAQRFQVPGPETAVLGC